MTQEVKLRRVQCDYQPENSRFLLECDFSKQYHNYYRKRLAKTRPFLEYNARCKWDSNLPIYNLAEVATFSVAGNLDDSDLGASPPTMTPPRSRNKDESEDLGTPTAGGYHMFPKRIRRISASSVTNYPKTSTQKDETETPSSAKSPLGQVPGINETPILRRASTSSSAECIVIGTLFKRMKLQPSVVEELSKGDFHVKCERYLGHYTSQDDTLVLEDMEESISLTGNFNPKDFVTGICVALLGYSINDGSQFLVRDICYAEPNRHILYDDIQLSQLGKLDLSLVDSQEQPIYLMMISGLGFHHEMDKKSTSTRALQNLIDFVWNGGEYSNDNRSHCVARILIVGDSLHEDRLGLDGDDEDDYGLDPDDIATKMKRSRQVKQYSKSISSVKHADDFFAQLSKTINVDVMPGPSDPSSHLMPQQPFHPCMFAKSSMYTTFNCTTNPHHAIYNEDVEILATSGQNIDIIRKFSALDDAIDIMKNHLKWGSSAPSAPDNLYSVPYEDEDPYVIDFIPDLYIAGCQDSYQRDYYYYTANEPVECSSPILQHNSFHSSKNESTVMNVTPESVRSRSTQETTTSNKIFINNSNISLTGSSPGVKPAKTDTIPPSFGSRLAGESQGSYEGGSSDHSSPHLGYIPNQLALQREMNLQSIPKKSRTLMITLPKFHESFSCVLVNLKNLESHLICFR